MAVLCGWPPPIAGTPAKNGSNAAGNNDSSRKTVALSGWPTPTAKLGDSGRGSPSAETAMARFEQGKRNLDDAAAISGPARVTASGELLTGCSAVTVVGGQLNPAHSRWLMGYPAAWERLDPNWLSWRTWQDFLANHSQPQNDSASGS